MLRVTYAQEAHLLTLQGHARSGAYGRDLICAAASILALTLEAAVGRLAAQGFVTEPETLLGEGYARISCRPSPGQEDLTRQVFSSICAGYELLAEAYPQYVSYSG